jgi:MFS family permease
MITQWAARTFASLGQRDYRVLWLGTTAAFLAFMMSSIVQNVVAFDLTGTNEAVGTVSLGMGVATLLVAPFGGVIADRVSKRRLLLLGQAAIGINFFAVGLLIVTDRITIAWLVASTFVLGTMFSFIAPARQAWLGDMLPTEMLPNGIALQQISMTGTRVFGPFLAGGLVALPFVDTGGTYLLMGLLFAFVVATLARLPRTQGRSKGSGPGMFEDFQLGMRHLRERRSLMLLELSFIGTVMAGFSYQVVLPGYLENQLGRDPGDISWMFGVSAIAGLVVTVGMATSAGSRHAWRLMFVAGLLLGGALMLTSIAQTFPQALAVMLLLGVGTSGFQLLNNALVMQESDPAYYGRVMSITMVAWGLNGLAGYPFGILGDAAGERATLLVMGLLVIAVSVAVAVAGMLVRRVEPPVVPRPRVAAPGAPAAVVLTEEPAAKGADRRGT